MSLLSFVLKHKDWKEIENKMKLDRQQCADLIANIRGNQFIEEHLNEYGEILLHVLAGDLITEPLIELLRWNKQTELITVYCNLIEQMWRDGNDDVVNVVDVTILERLSDEEKIWYRFGAYISDEFKRFINEEQIPNNRMMPKKFL